MTGNKSTVAPAYFSDRESGREEIRLIDSPISGGATRAANGSLSIFSSGEDSHLAGAHPVLESLSAKLYTIPGGLGMGSAAKLIPQIFIAMASEAMGLAAAAELDTGKALGDYRRTSQFCPRLVTTPSLFPQID